MLAKFQPLLILQRGSHFQLRASQAYVHICLQNTRAHMLLLQGFEQDRSMLSTCVLHRKYTYLADLLSFRDGATLAYVFNSKTNQLRISLFFFFFQLSFTTGFGSWPGKQISRHVRVNSQLLKSQYVFIQPVVEPSS